MRFMNIQAARTACEDDMFRPIAANMWGITNVQPVHPNTLERRNMRVDPLLRYTVTLQQNVHVIRLKRWEISWVRQLLNWTGPHVSEWHAPNIGCAVFETSLTVCHHHIITRMLLLHSVRTKSPHLWFHWIHRTFLLLGCLPTQDCSSAEICSGRSFSSTSHRSVVLEHKGRLIFKLRLYCVVI